MEGVESGGDAGKRGTGSLYGHCGKFVYIYCIVLLWERERAS